MIIFSFRWHVAEKALVGCRDWFGVIVNLLPHLELLLYAKPISLIIVSTNVYGIIFDQVYLLSRLTTPPPPLFLLCFFVGFWWCCIWLLDRLNIFIRVWKSMLWLYYWIFNWVIQVTRSLTIVFVSFCEVSCMWCPSRKRSFPIRHFNFQGRCWLY